MLITTPDFSCATKRQPIIAKLWVRQSQKRKQLHRLIIRKKQTMAMLSRRLQKLIIYFLQSLVESSFIQGCFKLHNQTNFRIKIFMSAGQKSFIHRRNADRFATLAKFAKHLAKSFETRSKFNRKVNECLVLSNHFLPITSLSS